ncbi:MAG: hypothetical protein Q8Q59_02175 [Luteolibacter sp.]|jgi:hypothetical protein|nr:hypothetical protein [Luteolibacter sp.]
MKPALSLICFLLLLPASAEEAEKQRLDMHRDGSEKLADEQDELSADVQQLVIEQTVPQVIELLGQVEEIMDEATDRLADADTGGETMAAQTEIIEKIHAAAKERQSQSGEGQSGSAMMDMMERMMGRKPEGEGKGEGKEKGDQPGDKAGEGSTGLSDSANEATAGAAGDGKDETRRVPKAGGAAGREIPSEFRKAFDAYNRGAEQKAK